MALPTPYCIDTVTKEDKREQREQHRETAVGKEDGWRHGWDTGEEKT